MPDQLIGPKARLLPLRRQRRHIPLRDTWVHLLRLRRPRRPRRLRLLRLPRLLLLRLLLCIPVQRATRRQWLLRRHRMLVRQRVRRQGIILRMPRIHRPYIRLGRGRWIRALRLLLLGRQTRLRQRRVRRRGRRQLLLLLLLRRLLQHDGGRAAVEAGAGDQARALAARGLGDERGGAGVVGRVQRRGRGQGAVGRRVGVGRVRGVLRAVEGGAAERLVGGVVAVGRAVVELPRGGVVVVVVRLVVEGELLALDFLGAVVWFGG